MDTVKIEFMTDWNEEEITFLIEKDHNFFNEKTSISITKEEYDKYHKLDGIVWDAEAEFNRFISDLRIKYGDVDE